MKALTISQPFASLIASGEKWIENRTWYTSYRGPLAIHAGKGKQYLSKPELAEYPTGCVIAIAELANCVDWNEIQRNGDRKITNVVRLDGVHTWREAMLHKHCEGPWCWILSNVRRIEPISVNGAQGLWTFDAKVVEAT